MGDKKPIHRLREILVTENRWLALYFDEVCFPDGKTGNYNRLVEKGGDGVAIVPVDREGRLGFVRLYRYPIDKYLWELPRGFGEGALLHEEAARELGEETGMKAGQITFIGKVYPNTGISSTGVNVVVACDLEPATITGDLSEAIEDFRFFDISAIEQMVRDGEIADCISLTALHLYQVFGFGRPL